MKKRWLLLPLCLSLTLCPATALAAAGDSGAEQLNFLLYASVTSAQTARGLADALLQRAASWEDLVPRPDPGQSCPEQAAALLEAANAVRQARGLLPLTVSESLAAQAAERAAGFPRSLRRPGGLRRLCAGPRAAGSGTAGELHDLEQASPAAVLHGWLYTPEARAVLLDEAYSQAGAGCFLQNGRHYWVLLLGSGAGLHVLLPPGGPCRGLAGGSVPSGGE